MIKVPFFTQRLERYCTPMETNFYILNPNPIPPRLKSKNEETNKSMKFLLEVVYKTYKLFNLYSYIFVNIIVYIL